jgi:hypothetical protein
MELECTTGGYALDSFMYECVMERLRRLRSCGCYEEALGPADNKALTLALFAMPV